MSAKKSSSVSGYRFGRHKIYPHLGLLLRDEQRIELKPRAFEILSILVESAGCLVGKDVLIDRVWGTAAIEENNIQAQISAIRKALGPDRDLISTEFGRGYRLQAHIGDTDPKDLFSPAVATHATGCALPIPVTSLIGRSAEIAELPSFLTQGRLVTVVGPGGVGKTRLAIETGRSMLGLYPSGIFFAELGKVSDHQLVWPTIAAALQIPGTIPAGSARLPGVSESRRTLLVADNCEHVVDVVADIVTALLQNCAGLQVLATAQEPLGAPGEQVYRLAPLTAPPRDIEAAESVSSYAAVQLFVERLASVMRDFRITDGNASVISEICRRLDGIPLALELAAARVSALGVNGVLTGLDDRFRLLTAGRRTALPKHRTLRSTVDWSFNLLRRDEQILFRRLAVFPSEFTSEAANDVAGSDTARWQTVDGLGELTAKSLLSVDLHGPVARYRMLETIRLYALEKLAGSDEVESIVERHALFTASAVERAERDWRTMATEEWLEAHRTGLDDIRAALDWAFSQAGSARIGIRILAHSVPFWIQYSRHHEGQFRISEALKQGSKNEPVTDNEEMALQASLGTSLNWAKGPVQDTRQAWQRALALATRLSDSEAEIQAHYGLWLYYLRSGDYAVSLDHAARLAARARKDMDSEAYAVGRRIMGVSHHFLGHHAEGRKLIESALIWYGRNRPMRPFRFGLDQQIAGLAFLSRVLWIEGRTDTAIQTAAEAIERARAIDHACTLCCALAEGWCMVHALNGDKAAVALAAPTLIREATTHGLGFWKAYGELFLAWAQAGPGAAGSNDSHDPLAAVSDMEFDPLYSNLVTDLLLQLDRDHLSLSGLISATDRADRSKDFEYWSAPELLRVRSLAENDDQKRRVRLLRESCTLARKQGALALALRSTLDLAKALAAHRQHRDALCELQPLLQSFPEPRLSRDWQAARVWCDEAPLSKTAKRPSGRKRQSANSDS